MNATEDFKFSNLMGKWTQKKGGCDPTTQRQSDFTSQNDVDRETSSTKDDEKERRGSASVATSGTESSNESLDTPTQQLKEKEPSYISSRQCESRPVARPGRGGLHRSTSKQNGSRRLDGQIKMFEAPVPESIQTLNKEDELGSMNTEHPERRNRRELMAKSVSRRQLEENIRKFESQVPDSIHTVGGEDVVRLSTSENRTGRAPGRGCLRLIAKQSGSRRLMEDQIKKFEPESNSADIFSEEAVPSLSDSAQQEDVPTNGLDEDDRVPSFKPSKRVSVRDHAKQFSLNTELPFWAKKRDSKTDEQTLTSCFEDDEDGFGEDGFDEDEEVQLKGFNECQDPSSAAKRISLMPESRQESLAKLQGSLRNKKKLLGLESSKSITLGEDIDEEESHSATQKRISLMPDSRQESLAKLEGGLRNKKKLLGLERESATMFGEDVYEEEPFSSADKRICTMSESRQESLAKLQGGLRDKKKSLGFESSKSIVFGEDFDEQGSHIANQKRISLMPDSRQESLAKLQGGLRNKKKLLGLESSKSIVFGEDSGEEEPLSPANKRISMMPDSRQESLAKLQGGLRDKKKMLGFESSTNIDFSESINEEEPEIERLGRPNMASVSEDVDSRQDKSDKKKTLSLEKSSSRTDDPSVSSTSVESTTLNDEEVVVFSLNSQDPKEGSREPTRASLTSLCSLDEKKKKFEKGPTRASNSSITSLLSNESPQSSVIASVPPQRKASLSSLPSLVETKKKFENRRLRNSNASMLSLMSIDSLDNDSGDDVTFEFIDLEDKPKQELPKSKKVSSASANWAKLRQRVRERKGSLLKLKGTLADKKKKLGLIESKSEKDPNEFPSEPSVSKPLNEGKPDEQEKRDSVLSANSSSLSFAATSAVNEAGTEADGQEPGKLTCPELIKSPTNRRESVWGLDRKKSLAKLRGTLGDKMKLFEEKQPKIRSNPLLRPGIVDEYDPETKETDAELEASGRSVSRSSSIRSGRSRRSRSPGLSRNSSARSRSPSAIKRTSILYVSEDSTDSLNNSPIGKKRQGSIVSLTRNNSSNSLVRQSSAASIKRNNSMTRLIPPEVFKPDENADETVPLATEPKAGPKVRPNASSKVEKRRQKSERNHRRRLQSRMENKGNFVMRTRNVRGHHMDASEESFDLPVFEKTLQENQLIYKALENNFVFNDLSTFEMKAMIQAFEKFDVPSGGVIIKQGDIGDYFYIIADGEVTFQVNDVTVGTAKEGKSFGELALLYKSPRAATVLAASDSTHLFRVDQKTFRHLLRSQSKQSEEEKLDLLRGVPFLKDFVESDLLRLSSVMTPRKFLEDDYIVRKGETGDAFYVLKEGEVKVTDISVGSTKYEDVTLNAGAYFGERALVTSEPRAANVVGLTGGTAFLIGRDTFEKVLGDFSRVILKSQDKVRLQGVKLLQNANLESSKFDILASLIQDEVYDPEECIFEEDGMTEPALFLVREGKVEISTEDGSRSEVIEAGGYFGDELLLAGVLEDGDITAVMSDYTTVITGTETCILGVLTLADCSTVFEPYCLIPEVGNRRSGNRSTLSYDSRRRSDRFSKRFSMKVRDTLRESVNSAASLEENLVKQSVLGQGSFGDVWLVRGECDGESEEFALKIQDKEAAEESDIVAADILRREVDILKVLDHPFIVELIHSYETEDTFYLVLNYISGGELWNVIHWEGADGVWISGIPEFHARFYALVLADTMAYIHSENVIYRDLKPENVVIDEDGYPVIVDFGFAKICDDKTYTFCGTPNYLAPEIIQNRGHGVGVDHWALGVLIYEMIAGENPFYYEGMDQLSLYEAICEEDYFPLSEDNSFEVIDLLKRLLEKDPTQRIGMLAGREKDILTHEWFHILDLAKLRFKEIVPPWVPPVEDED